jgi:hypothetical protein
MKLLNHSLKARVYWLLASCLALLISSPVPGTNKLDRATDEHGLHG